MTNTSKINIDSYYMICQYTTNSILAGAHSTSLDSISLPARGKSESSYLQEPNILTSGTAYVIQLLNLSVSCNSTNFDIRLLNKDDISLIDTINEFYKNTSVNKKLVDHNFDTFIIINRDIPITNNIYLYISNNDSIDTGTIRLEIVYKTIYDNPIVE